MRLSVAIAAVAALLVAPAQARHLRAIPPPAAAKLPCEERFQGVCEAAQRARPARPAYAAPAAHAARDARPRRWCGWYARHYLASQDPGPAYNLARNWARWGAPASPGVGVIVVWRHHVGLIVGIDANGNWIVRSGNDGHAVRERPMSTDGAIAFRKG